MFTNKALARRASIRRAQLWLAEREVVFWMISATSMEVETSPEQSRIRFFPLTGAVRIGNWYYPRRGFPALREVLLDHGIDCPALPQVVVRRQDLPEWDDPREALGAALDRAFKSRKWL